MQQTEIYTDGATFPNPGIGGWAFVATFNNEVIDEDCGSERFATNNTMELTAIIKAMQWLIDNNVKNATIYTDSQYAQKAITRWYGSWIKFKGLSKRKNIDLISDAVKLYKESGCKLLWINGHNGNIWNEHADNLANSVMLELYKEVNDIQTDTFMLEYY
jgi:ribonuclease HI